MAMNPYEMLLMQRPFSAGLATPYEGSLGTLLGAIQGFQQDFPRMGQVSRSPLSGAQSLYDSPFYGRMSQVQREGSGMPEQAEPAGVEGMPSGFMRSADDNPYRRTLPPQLLMFAGLGR